MLTKQQNYERSKERKRWLWAICLGIGLGVLTASLSFVNWLGGLSVGILTFVIYMMSTAPQPPDIER